MITIFEITQNMSGNSVQTHEGVSGKFPKHDLNCKSVLRDNLYS